MLRRNRKLLSRILVSLFYKRKEPIKYCLGKQTNFSIFLRNNRVCMDVDPYKAKKRYICTRRKFPLYEKKIWIQQENSYKISFPARRNNDTTTQLYCTLSTYVTPKTISRQNQKNIHNTTTVWYSKYINSM